LRPSLQHILEFRGVFHVDLQEQNHCVLRDVVVFSLFYQLPGVLFWVVAEAAMGDDVYLVPWLASSMNLLTVSSISIRSWRSSSECLIREMRARQL
jgi:hypothetical protein